MKIKLLLAFSFILASCSIALSLSNGSTGNPNTTPGVKPTAPPGMVECQVEWGEEQTYEGETCKDLKHEAVQGGGLGTSRDVNGRLQFHLNCGKVHVFCPSPAPAPSRSN